MKKFAMAALLVVALVGTASATEYLWFEVIGAAPANLSQGPMMDLEFDCPETGGTFDIGMYISDEGLGLRGYGVELYGDDQVAGSAPIADVGGIYPNHPIEFAGPGAGAIFGATVFTVQAPPIMGSGTLVAQFTLDVLPGTGAIDITGGWTYSVNHGSGYPNWGGYYFESYIGDDHQAYGTYGNHVGYAGNMWTSEVITINRIPEPATLVLLGLGAVALLRRR